MAGNKYYYRDTNNVTQDINHVLINSFENKDFSTFFDLYSGQAITTNTSYNTDGTINYLSFLDIGNTEFLRYTYSYVGYRVSSVAIKVTYNAVVYNYTMTVTRDPVTNMITGEIIS